MKPIRKTQLLDQYQNIVLSLVKFSEDYELDPNFYEEKKNIRQRDKQIRQIFLQKMFGYRGRMVFRYEFK